MALYVGTNYHPHDWTPERWKKDIALMKEAGFQAVRLGHLCWDSYEPQDGVYNFQWFDEVMDGFYEAGIKVFLDVSVRRRRYGYISCAPAAIYLPREGTDRRR